MHIPQLMWIIDGKEESLKESRSFLKKWRSLILLAQRPQPKQTLIAKVRHYTLIKIDDFYETYQIVFMSGDFPS